MLVFVVAWVLNPVYFMGQPRQVLHKVFLIFTFPPCFEAVALAVWGGMLLSKKTSLSKNT